MFIKPRRLIGFNCGVGRIAGVTIEKEGKPGTYGRTRVTRLLTKGRKDRNNFKMEINLLGIVVVCIN